jgi:hypothetical protein
LSRRSSTRYGIGFFAVVIAAKKASGLVDRSMMDRDTLICSVARGACHALMSHALMSDVRAYVAAAGHPIGAAANGADCLKIRKTLANSQKPANSQKSDAPAELVEMPRIIAGTPEIADFAVANINPALGLTVYC